MKRVNTSAKALATIVGCIVLFVSCNKNVMATGGYASSQALLIAGLSLGVFAGARAVGARAVSGGMALALIVALVCGEVGNLWLTGERIVKERDEAQTPLLAAAKARQEAKERLEELEHSKATSARLEAARDAKAAADDAVTKEAADIRCGKECLRKQGLADAAGRELVAAAQEAQGLHAKAIEDAKAELERLPVPADANALATRLGVPGWLLDLLVAAALSIGANGLAGVLIAVGTPAEAPAHRNSHILPAKQESGQTDFDPSFAEASLRYFREGPFGDGPPGSGRRPPDRPRPRPTDGRTVGLSKADALSDLRQRIADGRTVGSQDELADDWRRPKQTVSDWLREWRSFGIIPPAIADGRRKTIVGEGE